MAQKSAGTSFGGRGHFPLIFRRILFVNIEDVKGYYEIIAGYIKHFWAYYPPPDYEVVDVINFNFLAIE